MNAVKVELIKEYGRYCMLCRRKLKSTDCTYHHMIPEAYGGDYTVENGAILCEPCHKIVHIFKYEEEGYKRLNKAILKNKVKGV